VVTRVAASAAARLAPRSAAAEIRAQGSDGERALETQLRQTGATGWVRELQFDPARRWRFDFAWPDLSVAMEVEGGTYAEGRHSRGSGFEQDCVKYATAAIAGWRVIRVTTEMVEDGRALALIERMLGAAMVWRSTTRGAGCWLWDGWLSSNGYGLTIDLDTHSPRSVHRLVYELAFGPIPAGLTIDHTCHNGSGCPGGNACPHRKCVRPDHLEAISHGDNVRRAQATGDRCRRGHLRSRTPGGRWWCRSCQQAGRARRATRELPR
jgi:very-short-patch-repair endonuclease